LKEINQQIIEDNKNLESKLKEKHYKYGMLEEQFNTYKSDLEM